MEILRFAQKHLISNRKIVQKFTNRDDEENNLPTQRLTLLRSGAQHEKQTTHQKSQGNAGNSTVRRAGGAIHNRLLGKLGQRAVHAVTGRQQLLPVVVVFVVVLVVVVRPVVVTGTVAFAHGFSARRHVGFFSVVHVVLL